MSRLQEIITSTTNKWDELKDATERDIRMGRVTIDNLKVIDSFEVFL